MGPWMADTIRQCDGLVDEMSYWTFSDVFEEQGVVKKPFYGGYGLIAAGGIPKPAFAAFKILHKLGQERLALDSDSALVTRAADGSLVVAVWNLVPPDQTGAAKSVVLRFKNMSRRVTQRFRELTGSMVIRIQPTKKWDRRCIRRKRNWRSCATRWRLARRKFRS